jgi:Family of unknown function (DUF5681)
MNPNRDLSNQRSNEREAMNPSENYQVGYGRPPMHTRWRKGRTGNPKRNRKRAPPPVFLMIEAFFAGEIEIVENGISRRVSNFEAVILQLWLKAMAGNKHAMNVLLKYKEFAASRGDMGGIEVLQVQAEDITREELFRRQK